MLSKTVFIVLVVALMLAATATGGKTNEIDEGYIDVTDGP